MKKPLLNFLLPLALLLVLFSGCGNLDKAGVYHGDKILYSADKAIAASYTTFHGFVKWEYDNREALASQPEIKKAADRVRLNARRWLTTASVLREAYAANPTSNNKAELQKAWNILQAAILEATIYLNQP